MLISPVTGNPVEVFKTNVEDPADAQLVIQKLRDILPHAKINFDLCDCDRVLRIETARNPIDVDAIIIRVRQLNFQIEMLE